jgi:hypothetical protein
VKLAELQQLANKGYAHGDGIGDYFDHETGQPTTWHAGDSLEWFMHVEIAETFDPDATDADQISEAERVIERAVEELQGVLTELNNHKCEG